MKESLDDRMKLYENMEAGGRLMPLLPALCRLDGRGFHNFTKGMKRPYDERLAKLMIDITEYLVKETNACIGYTQSDEITLAWNNPTQIYFDGRIHKMVSVLAATASVMFNKKLPEFFGKDADEYLSKNPLFDCRVWNVPNVIEGANAILWREQDATKNAISMAARAYYSHSSLHNKNGSQMQEMLHQKGVNFNNYPSFFKRGTFIQKKVKKCKLSPEEIDKLPPEHDACKNPDLEFERSFYYHLEMPPFSKVINRPQVIFEGADPVTNEVK